MDFKNKKEKDDFILKNMGLVDFVISKKLIRYNRYEYDYEDIRQMGYLQLVRSVENFDESKGYEFSTYATSCILNGILKELRETRNGIKYGRKVILNKHKIEMMLPYMKVEDIAKKLNLKVEDVNTIKDINLTPISLNNPLKIAAEDGDIDYMDIVNAYEEDYDTNIYIEYLLNNITERERYVIIESFYKGRTQQQIALKIGLSQMQISRIIKKALRKMKKCA